MHTITRLLLATALAATSASQLAAQTLDPDSDAPRRERRPSRTFLGLGLQISQPIGEFDRFTNEGAGFSGNLVHQLDRFGALALRAELGMLIYGHSSRRFTPFPGIPVQARATTDNTIFLAGFGPQVMVPSGPVRPYVNGTVGFSYFSTSSSVEGIDDQDEDLFDTTNQDDGTFNWGVGGGLYIPVARKARNPVSIDIGVRFISNGEAEYLREGSLRTSGNTIIINPIRSEANFVSYHLGVSFGL